MIQSTVLFTSMALTNIKIHDPRFYLYTKVNKSHKISSSKLSNYNYNNNPIPMPIQTNYNFINLVCEEKRILITNLKGQFN